MDNQVNSYCIYKSADGIIELLLNTNKWLGYSVDENHKGVTVTFTWYPEGEIQNIESTSFSESWEILNIDLEKESVYKRFVEQNKDQIVITWVPIRLFKNGDKAKIVKCEHG